MKGRELHRAEENTVLFNNQLIGSLHKYINTDPSSDQGQALWHHSTNQSVLDIWHKLQKLQMFLRHIWPGFYVLNNLDLDETEKKKGKEKWQARIMSVTNGSALHIPKSSKGKSKTNKRKSFFFKCKQTEHWTWGHIKPPLGPGSVCQVASVPYSWP